MRPRRYLLFIIIVAFTFQMNAQSVYTTKTGEKYHTKNCHYLKYSKKEITLEKAIELRYKACKVCKPPRTKSKQSTRSNLQSNSSSAPPSSSVKKTVASQCTGKTKSGNRCKRRTKSSSGRCYQH